jgi:hypothetical protein
LGGNRKSTKKNTKALLDASRLVCLEVNKNLNIWLFLATRMQDKSIILLLLINRWKMC